MFISKVIFESAKENEDLLKEIMKKKLSDTGTEGLVSRECWRQEGAETVGYALVNKWERKEYFRKFMADEEHARGHKERRNLGGRPAIKKIASQYESVETEQL